MSALHCLTQNLCVCPALSNSEFVCPALSESEFVCPALSESEFVCPALSKSESSLCVLALSESEFVCPAALFNSVTGDIRGLVIAPQDRSVKADNKFHTP